MRIRLAVILTIWTSLGFIGAVKESNAQTLPDIVFVGMVPQANDFTVMSSAFGNHLSSMQSSPRGGGLYVRYADGSVRNLTQDAGYGDRGLQGEGAIAVRDPVVSWDGTKILFSMIVGAPRLYEVRSYYWQLYEMTGVKKGETPRITKVAGQPGNYNNIMPAYGSNDQIIFVSDRPRNGASNLYPQLDEYEAAPTNTGLWVLNPATQTLQLLDHSPSGDFEPIVDSYGRIVFTRWDHLQRDQQGDNQANSYGAVNYSNESTTATKLGRYEVFPEPRSDYQQVDKTINKHTLNHFFPWAMNQDGTDDETLNHMGRHEFHRYFMRSFNDDSSLEDYLDQFANRANPTTITNFMHISESLHDRGTYLAINAPFDGTHAAGQLVMLTGALGLNPNMMRGTSLSHPDTALYSGVRTANHSGFYRDPIMLEGATIIAAHTLNFGTDSNVGTSSQPKSQYNFRLHTLKKENGYFVPDRPLTSGLPVSISYYTPDIQQSYSGNLWEVQPVPLIARPRPSFKRESSLPSVEAKMFADEAVNVAEFKRFLSSRHLALIVSRNVTTRDAADTQQPYNLRVAGTTTSTRANSGKLYDVSMMQFFQGNLIRGYDTFKGRRVLAQPMTSGMSYNRPWKTDVSGAVKLFNDGSVAAYVPADRALSWQLTSPKKEAVVRERYWVTFQSGEVRVCTTCHGVNTVDQKGNPPPVNPPEALRAVLRDWKVKYQ